ncbi:hypothetical protein NM688_g5691 [Phlebia brevispora]|uniref:Uncharacterized protein n=1 Tax=Phlebia brevispora TaxID=194682 RepID=A0ACC1SR84_9APHY|nr:hypothetical protein NM688_g5691 [Phlebia brevispora]
MGLDRGNETTTQLLTLLNVSATKAGKRKWVEDHSRPKEKLNKRRVVLLDEPTVNIVPADEEEDTPVENEDKDEEPKSGGHAEEKGEGENKEDDAEDTSENPYESHFGPKSSVISEQKRTAVDNKSWKTSRHKFGKLGSMVEYSPDTPDAVPPERLPSNPAILERLHMPFEERQAKLPQELATLQNDLLTLLSTHRDLQLSGAPLDSQQSLREAITLHCLDHITEKRRRVLKNNERLAHASKSGNSAPEDVQDQGFTRPSVLILLPFRSFALRWVAALTSHTPSPAFQVENRSRFQSEYGLPPGAVDKLETAEPGTYPKDHVEMFKGNVDDSFRVGVKITRKSVKLFADFYGCDLIIASPLGLRMSIEKEKNADFLSSIEILVVDQMDALTMQNWDHVQFVFSHLNKLPKESHDVDFSRIKPCASYLRQSIFLSAYETPETRALFNSSLHNVAGKLRTERRWQAVPVPEGVDQNFVHFECTNPKDELDKRFQFFTTQARIGPARCPENHFRKAVGASFAVLSEYSSNQDISRARQAFFSGKKSFLLISERFHFFRRYKIRGIRNIIFYAPPDHPQFYTEFLSYPFLDDGVEPGDVTCKVIYSRYDYMRLERIAGADGAKELISRGSV